MNHVMLHDVIHHPAEYEFFMEVLTVGRGIGIRNQDINQGESLSSKFIILLYSKNGTQTVESNAIIVLYRETMHVTMKA